MSAPKTVDEVDEEMSAPKTVDEVYEEKLQVKEEYFLSMLENTKRAKVLLAVLEEGRKQKLTPTERYRDYKANSDLDRFLQSEKNYYRDLLKDSNKRNHKEMSSKIPAHKVMALKILADKEMGIEDTSCPWKWGAAEPQPGWTEAKADGGSSGERPGEIERVFHLNGRKLQGRDMEWPHEV